jgi:hypothetical protein
MTDPTNDENDQSGGVLASAENNESGDGKKGKSGETDTGGLIRKEPVTTNVARLTPQKLKQVMADWRHLTAQDLIDALVEFFGENPMRASANAAVSWVKNANAKSFAIVNWVLEFGENAVRELVRTRERTASRDTKGLRHGQKQRPGPAGIVPGLNGPTGPTGN